MHFIHLTFGIIPIADAEAMRGLLTCLVTESWDSQPLSPPVPQSFMTPSRPPYIGLGVLIIFL